MPTLHSLIVIAGSDVVLESIAIEPPLMVNGRRVTSATLSHGDRIEIGPFQLTARMIPPVAALTPAAEPTSREDADDGRSPAELSAQEIVDRLEQELQSVENFDARRELGAASLIESAGMTASKPESTTPGEVAAHLSDRMRRVEGSVVPAPHFRAGRVAEKLPRSDEVFVDELQRLHDDLQSFSRWLEARAERLSHQEASVTEAAAELVEAQQRLSRQLTLLLSQTKPQAESQQIVTTLVRASA